MLNVRIAPADAMRNRAERMAYIRRKRQRSEAAPGGGAHDDEAGGNNAALQELEEGGARGAKRLRGAALLEGLAPEQARAVVANELTQFYKCDARTTDKCAEGFLKALMFLRVVLAQDMAAMCARPAPCTRSARAPLASYSDDAWPTLLHLFQVGGVPPAGGQRGGDDAGGGRVLSVVQLRSV